MTAARTGIPGPVELLIAHGAEVNAKEHKGQTALMWAAAEGNVKVVDLLLAAAADYRATQPTGYTPLFFAVREAHRRGENAVESWHRRERDDAPAEKALRQGSGRGHVAADSCHRKRPFRSGRGATRRRADPNDERTGYTPLHTITWVRRPNLGDGDDGNPPPIGSGKMNSLQLLRTLVAHGASVNAQLKRGPNGGKGALGRPGATPFLMAASTADVPLLQTLLELGADPLLANNENCTPFLAAAGVGVVTAEETVGAEPEVLESLELLLKHGADVNTVEKNGETAMHGVAHRNHPKVVQFLADHGAKIELWNEPNKHKLDAAGDRRRAPLRQFQTRRRNRRRHPQSHARRRRNPAPRFERFGGCEIGLLILRSSNAAVPCHCPTPGHPAARAAEHGWTVFVSGLSLAIRHACCNSRMPLAVSSDYSTRT